MARFCNAKEKGFGLIELLVAMAISGIVAMAAYAVFSASNWSYLVQTDVSQAQKNVRVAMERLSKDIREAGFGLPDPPFNLDFGGNSFTSHIKVNNESTAPDEITLVGIGYEVGTLHNSATLNCNEMDDSSICLDPAADIDRFFEKDASGNTTSNFHDERRYISLDGIRFFELSTTDSDHDRSNKQLGLASPSQLDRDYSNETKVFILKAVRYSVQTDADGMLSLKSKDYTGLRRPFMTEVRDIEDIQFAYSTSASGAFVNDPSSPGDIKAVQVNVLGRSRHPDPKGRTNFKRPAMADRPEGSSDAYRRRLLTKVVRVRNPIKD